jgi:hypothetical protein
MILLISASQVAGISGVSHGCLAQSFFLSIGTFKVLKYTTPKYGFLELEPFEDQQTKF